ncbi:mandelate racemase/muconate lactonizing enzyme family protein [Jiangella asiatica]|uniref:glucarate dehydratase n=1 Tax=Jiangella asiatica TaxID=2530372 RepID=A0A4R5DF18_9ACTN|nr:mandelate racemase/muconate lactonizing enzyme family protein [Jiangella asiatica]TDE10354.1 mandelate racemase [Jiangella asiatica]
MTRPSRIERIRATEVVVPALPGAVDSPSLNRPLHNKPWRGASSWSVQFDRMPKVILELELRDGTVGLGELYRAHDWEVVDAVAAALVGQDVRAMSLQEPPVARTHEFDGFEMALWDAYARSAGLRVVDLLGGPVRDRIPVSAWSSHRTVDEIGDIVAPFAAAGFTNVKLKCSLDDDVVAWCQAIAERAPGMSVVLDPNGRFERLADARALGLSLAEVGNVGCLEDPLPHWAVDDWVELRRAVPIPLARHLSLAYPQFADRGSELVAVLRRGSADMLNLTAGLNDFRRLDHVADVFNLTTWHGSQVDLGIAEAAYLHSCAAARTCTQPSDVFGRLIRCHDLLREPLRIEPPYAHLPDGPGLGVSLDEEARAEFRTAEREYVAR